MFIFNTVIKEKDNTLKSKNTYSETKEDAQKVLDNIVKDIINQYGMCKDIQYLEDSIQFNYENNRKVHIFIEQIKFSNPRVIIESDRGVIKSISATKDVEVIALDYNTNIENPKKGR